MGMVGTVGVVEIVKMVVLDASLINASFCCFDGVVTGEWE